MAGVRFTIGDGGGGGESDDTIVTIRSGSEFVGSIILTLRLLDNVR